jgi:hypothetical protein
LFALFVHASRPSAPSTKIITPVHNWRLKLTPASLLIELEKTILDNEHKVEKGNQSKAITIQTSQVGWRVFLGKHSPWAHMSIPRMTIQ